ncbi:MAG: hypothetical protein AAFP81_05930 [Pseudomonadota bacterium]
MFKHLIAALLAISLFGGASAQTPATISISNASFVSAVGSHSASYKYSKKHKNYKKKKKKWKKHVKCKRYGKKLWMSAGYSKSKYWKYGHYDDGDDDDDRPKKCRHKDDKDPATW